MGRMGTHSASTRLCACALALVGHKLTGVYAHRAVLTDFATVPMQSFRCVACMAAAAHPACNRLLRTSLSFA